LRTDQKIDRHIWDAIADPHDLVLGRQALLAVAVCNQIANTGIKVSIHLFVRRMILRTSRRWLYWTIWITLALTVLTNFTYLVAILSSCTPLSAFWNRANIEWTASHNFKCLDEGVITVSGGFLCMVQDFMVATLPIIVLWVSSFH
jgi:hypothetical protein